MSCSAIKPKAEEEGDGAGGQGAVSQGGHCLEAGWASTYLWELGGDCLCVTFFFFPFLHPLTVFASKTVLTCLFSLVVFLSSSLSCWAGCSEQAALWVLGCWLVSTHHNTIQFNLTINNY